METKLYTFNFNLKKLNEKSLVRVFKIDHDFSNPEYYREDTLELGYKSEAERCSEEIFNRHKHRLNSDEKPIEVLKDMLNDVFFYQNDAVSFLTNSPNWCKSYDYKIITCSNCGWVVVALAVAS